MSIWRPSTGKGSAVVEGMLLALFLSGQTTFAEQLSPAESSPTLNLETPTLEVKKTSLTEDGPWTRLTPSLDSRFLLLLKEMPSTAGSEGLGLMQAIAGLDWSLADDLQAVVRYNFGFLGPGVRELYFDFQKLGPDSLKIGRFPLVFGFTFSDHRIYTKRFFGVSINDFETGAQAQKSFGRVRVTFSLVQGLGSGESFEINQILATPALDVRYDFEIQPLSFTVGSSAFQTYKVSGASQPLDHSAAVEVFVRALWGNLALTEETVYGHKRNSLGYGFTSFVGDPTFASTIAQKDCLGILLYSEYAMSKNWKVIYEYDQVVFDTHYMADRFQKHGIGARWAFHKAAELEGRVEQLLEGRTRDPDLGRNNADALLMLHAWF